MSDSIQEIQKRLDSIRAEASARNELAGKHVMESMESSKAEIEERSRELDEAMHAEYLAAANGVGLSVSRAGASEVGRFGFEEGEEFVDRPTELQARPAPVPQPRPEPTRRLRPEEVDDDDDFANFDWTSG